MHRPRFLRLIALFILLLFPSMLVSCNENDAFLSWNEPPLSFVGEYEENGVLFTADFSADGDVLTVTLLSPAAAADMTYRLEDGNATATYHGVTETLSALPAPLTRFLLLYPENAVLSEVTQDGNARVVHVVADGGSYCYRFEDGELPTLVTAETAHGFCSLTIRKE